MAVEEGWGDGRNFTVVFAIFSIPGIWRSPPASPTPSSTLQHYWAWSRNKQWLDKPEMCNSWDCGLISTSKQNLGRPLFPSLSCFSSLLFYLKKKSALARHDLLCLNISLSWWPVEQWKAMTEMAQRWCIFAKSLSSQWDRVLAFIPLRTSWQDIYIYTYNVYIYIYK